MAQLPEYESQVSPFVRNQPVRMDADVRGPSILAEHAEEFAGQMENVERINAETANEVQAKADHQQRVIQDLEQQKIGQLESQDVVTKTSQMRSDWYDHLRQMQANPSDDMFDKGVKDFEDYSQKMVDSGITGASKQELAIRAQDFGITLKSELWKTQQMYRQQKFGADFDKMMSNAENSIYAAKTIDELRAQQGLVSKAINDAVTTGRIRDPDTIEALKEKIPLLGVAWAEANITDNPQLVKDVASGADKYKGIMDGVSPEHREVLIDKANEVLRTQDAQGKVSLKEALDSDIQQRIQTGDGKSLDLDKYGEVYGQDKREEAERQLSNATDLHTYVESAKGASEQTLQSLLQKATPEPNPKDPLYSEKLDKFNDVQKIIAQARSDRDDDPFTYFSLNPSVKPYADAYQKNPTPYTTKSLQDAVLAQMKLDPTIPPSKYAVMPKQMAEDFISKFNSLVSIGSDKKGTAGVQDVLRQFSTDYKDNMQVALNQISSTKGGDKISPAFNSLMWHMNNDSIFNLIVQAIRKNPKEAMDRFGDEKTAKDFLGSVKLDRNLINYQNSVFSTSNTPQAQQLAKGVAETFQAFARDYVQQGGRLKDASSVFFGPYTWGNFNGVTYARPRVYTDSTGKQHSMTDAQAQLSNGYLEYYPQRLNPNEIAPESIVNQTRYFTSEQLTKDTKDALDHNTFWSTTEDEKGVYLYAKGALSGAPRQVFKKDGSPVRVDFADTLASIPAQAMEYNPKTKQMEEPPSRFGAPRTGDSWAERLAGFLIRAGD